MATVLRSSACSDRGAGLRSSDSPCLQSQHKTKADVVIRRLHFTYRGSRPDMLLVLEFSELFQIKMLNYKLPFFVPFLQICSTSSLCCYTPLYLASEKYYIKTSRKIHTIIFADFFPVSGTYSEETEQQFFLKSNNLLMKK